MNKKIKYLSIPLFILLMILLSGNGCMKLALRMSPELFQNISAQFFFLSFEIILSYCYKTLTKFRVLVIRLSEEGYIRSFPELTDTRPTAIGFSLFCCIIIQYVKDSWVEKTAGCLIIIDDKKSPELS